MLIFPPSRLHIDHWLKQCVHFGFYAVGAVIFVFLLFYFIYPWTKEETVLKEMELTQKKGKELFSYEAIGSGALALYPRHALGWVSRLTDELSLVSYNSRPDIYTKEAKILLALKNGKEYQILASGETLYLKESEMGKGLLSSDTSSNLWIKPLLLDNGSVLIEAGREYAAAGEERGQFLLSQQGGSPARFTFAQQVFAKELKSARSFHQDLLIQSYGGREYASWRDKVVLEFTTNSRTYACFVSSGDYLLYQAGEWRVVPLDELHKDLPIARVKTISSKAVEIQAWDETGFSPVQVTIEMEKPPRLQLKPEAMPSGMRLRNGTQISCAFGKRRMIIRSGDWLLKTNTGWRNLRRSEEIDHCLHHRLKGELFIFDAIEKEQGRYVMKGHLFDETRTQVQNLSLPIDIDKTQNKASRKRKSIFSTKEQKAV